ncbi:biliverdin-producing heme oxygenase [Algoriphagus sp. NG3]|uniref:biliverdin-producing heme oxygenase n=1 Tax=unclassified Algoriphagus TaxID=2641541 RepID=UPI002A814029|nr:biliverdin-producing heme oxygenase [Algoriphagus sp. NG3]WPR74148.1 biliverdin-producing heme oxygenase [Algoriphagus sp. NG3]
MRSAEATSPFSSRLKEATSSFHQELESLPISKSILKINITADEYLKYLNLMHDVVSEIEKKLFPRLQDLVMDLNDRKKSEWIEEDFRALGFEKNHTIEVFEKLNGEISSGYAMGMLYVIEGSTLGGRVIFKHLQRTLGYTSENGAAYFTGYGENTGLLWKNFICTLMDYEQKNKVGEEIIEGANYTFQAIGNHFKQATGD